MIIGTFSLRAQHFDPHEGAVTRDDLVGLLSQREDTRLPLTIRSTTCIEVASVFDAFEVVTVGATIPDVRAALRSAAACLGPHLLLTAKVVLTVGSSVARHEDDEDADGFDAAVRRVAVNRLAVDGSARDYAILQALRSHAFQQRQVAARRQPHVWSSQQPEQPAPVLNGLLDAVAAAHEELQADRHALTEAETQLAQALGDVAQAMHGKPYADLDDTELADLESDPDVRQARDAQEAAMARLGRV